MVGPSVLIRDSGCSVPFSCRVAHLGACIGSGRAQPGERAALVSVPCVLDAAVAELAGLPASIAVAINTNRGTCRSAGFNLSSQLGGRSL